MSAAEPDVFQSVLNGGKASSTILLQCLYLLLKSLDAGIGLPLISSDLQLKLIEMSIKMMHQHLQGERCRRGLSDWWSRLGWLRIRSNSVGSRW
uniref:Uncharacterized protein n=1 Tax=Manihot esculenta TaxID=3983 RepID=A0A2C9V306_MANES